MDKVQIRQEHTGSALATPGGGGGYVIKHLQKSHFVSHSIHQVSDETEQPAITNQHNRWCCTAYQPAAAGKPRQNDRGGQMSRGSSSCGRRRVAEVMSYGCDFEGDGIGIKSACGLCGVRYKLMRLGLYLPWLGQRRRATDDEVAESIVLCSAY